MNLADAIRQAAQSSGAPIGPNPAPPVEPDFEFDEVAKEISLVASPVNANADPAVSNVVRIELTLNPEQLSNLLKAIVAGQHSVLTLRDAAAYLRLPANVVEQMAIEGKLPALSVDGKWRFKHSALDEWLTGCQTDATAFDKAVGA
ncbi:MAG TPA: helix-turn-helix domain-containing protein [Fimbriimonadaceae bacterium]|nr:helix-turn-helix domain-containing protein [Fimbriimonadaceae bacterium]